MSLGFQVIEDEFIPWPRPKGHGLVAHLRWAWKRLRGKKVRVIKNARLLEVTIG
jgi:hypothetical protein